MSRLVVVPNALRDAIHAAIDAALVTCPEAAEHREVFFDQILAYYDEHGVIPSFTLEPTP